MNFKENVRAVGTGMLIGLGTSSLWLAGKAFNKDKTLSGMLVVAGTVSYHDRLCRDYGK